MRRPIELTRLDCWARIIRALGESPSIATFRAGHDNDNIVVEVDTLLWLAEGNV